VELLIEDGELVVRSPHAMQGYDVDGSADAPVSGRDWPTGDLVELVGDRVYFVGRRTDLINVGGNKVAPLEVERVLRTVTGVRDARVFGRRSSIAGELVVCQVVAADGADPEELRREMVAACVAELKDHQRPRSIEFVAAIPLEESGKTSRGAES
jgi:acyl-coenzyme A synthetase/AMP-(fatty) acid ligase